MRSRPAWAGRPIDSLEVVEDYRSMYEVCDVDKAATRLERDRQYSRLRLREAKGSARGECDWECAVFAVDQVVCGRGCSARV